MEEETDLQSEVDFLSLKGVGLAPDGIFLEELSQAVAGRQ